MALIIIDSLFLWHPTQEDAERNAGSCTTGGGSCQNGARLFLESFSKSTTIKCRLRIARKTVNAAGFVHSCWQMTKLLCMWFAVVHFDVQIKSIGSVFGCLASLVAGEDGKNSQYS